MSQNEKCFTFIWKIKNFNFCSIKTTPLKSPKFFVHVMGGSMWYLCLRPNSSGFKSCIACGIVATDIDYAPNQFEFDYELSFLADDGTVKYSEIFLRKLYKRGYEDWSASLYVRGDDVFPKTDRFVLEDFLTIRCRMWDSKYSIPMSGRCFAETVLETEYKSLEGKVENFSLLEPMKKYPININSTARGFYLSCMNLCIDACGKISIEMEQKSVSMCRYKICIIDSLRNKVKFGQGNVNDSKLHCIPLSLSTEHLMKNKRYYLPNDVLTIECQVTFPKGKTVGEIVDFEYQDTEGLISNAKTSVVFFEKQLIENLTTLKDDLTLLFSEGFLCDTKLKTATETFPAHTAILSARSPVFKSMFTNEMKEKISNCVDIDDLDADTLRRMLLFMYSANLDDLDFESAKNLYFAADKYNIISLFHRCSDFMKRNLMQSNWYDIFILADNHQDKELKCAVKDYIAINDKEVLLSDEWKELEKSHPQLSIEALRTVCMKNQRS